jgi:putative MATE family efflux protein
VNESAVAPPAVPSSPRLTAPILPTLLRLTLPNLASMFAATMVAVAETVYVGILGTVSLAAIALVFPLTMLMQMLSAGAMGGGVSSAISRALGAGDEHRAQVLAVHAAVIGLVVGLAFSLLFLFGAGPILRLLGGRGPVLEEALLYANIALVGATITWLLNTLASILRGAGNMRAPAAALLGASALQVVLGGAMGLGFGPVPRLGLAGVALGMVIAQASGTAFLLWFLSSGRARVALRPRRVALESDMFVDILKVGATSAIGPLQTVLGILVLTAFVARFGAEALAGYGIGVRLEFLLIPVVFAVGVASVPMVGMAIGARDVARARKVAWTSGALCSLALGILGTGVSLAPDLWSGIFTSDPGVRAAANLYLRWTGPGFAFLGLGFSLYFASQGSGRILPVVLAGASRLLIIVVGGAMLSAWGAPVWSVFALAALAMATFGVSIASAVYLTPWGGRRQAGGS